MRIRRLSLSSQLQSWKERVKAGSHDEYQCSWQIRLKLFTCEDRWNKFIWHILQWDAIPQNYAINWVEPCFQVKENINGRFTEHVLRFVANWKFGQDDSDGKGNLFGYHRHLPLVLASRQRIMLASGETGFDGKTCLSNLHIRSLHILHKCRWLTTIEISLFTRSS